MLLPKQIWKDISGYEGLYQVSNTGKVRSLNYKGTGKKKILKTGNTGYKRLYKMVNLHKNKKQKPHYVHRLVAEAFIPNPNNLPYVNHKDENPDNNAVWNLEWCTPKYNANYGTAIERMSKTKMGQNMGGDNINARKIKCVELDLVFDSIADAKRWLGKGDIQSCLRGKQHTAGGYHWTYI